MTTIASAPSAADTFAFRLHNVGVAFKGAQAVGDVSLSVAPGEFVAIVGPSGCGKTTLLSVLSGSLAPTQGTCERREKTRTVHQSDGLFPWRTVWENIELGLPAKQDERTAKQDVQAMLEKVGLKGFERHYPHQLSGGMRQRVEIARALAGNNHDALLLDEPFSALDYITRLKMRNELTRLLTQSPRTVVLVTHDIEEAAQLADRVIVLSERPATVRYELLLTAPRPRDVTGPPVTEAIRKVLQIMGV